MWRGRMKTSDMIRQLCSKENMSISELSRRMGQSPQNFSKKLKRDTVSLDELYQIADIMDATFEQIFTFKDGVQIVNSTKKS